MLDSTFEYFMADVFDEIQKRHVESQKDMNANPSDLFFCGRALAYNEVYEIIKNRMDIYGITMNQDHDDTTE